MYVPESMLSGLYLSKKVIILELSKKLKKVENKFFGKRVYIPAGKRTCTHFYWKEHLAIFRSLSNFGRIAVASLYSAGLDFYARILYLFLINKILIKIIVSGQHPTL